MEGYQFVLEQKVVWRDLDALGHVNNAVFATYVENGRMAYLQAVLGDLLPQHTPGPYPATGRLGLILAELTITYRSPAYLGEVLRIGVRVAEIRNSSFVMETCIEEKETGRLVATSRAVMVHYDYTENRPVPVPPEWREAMARAEGRSF
ncbi:MAG TPA: thioesterase family protein [Symbiobacteriaceae bacterium]